MHNRELVIKLVDYYLNFLSQKSNEFIIPEDPDNLVFLPEDCIVEILTSIKSKGYRNFDLFQIIKDEEIISRIRDLIEKINSEAESELKIAFAFPVIKVKDKNLYYAVSRIKLEQEGEKLIAISREFNKQYIEQLKELSTFANKDEIKIPEDKDDHEKDFDFYVSIMEIFAGLSHFHLIPLPEPLSYGVALWSILNGIKKIKSRLWSNEPQESPKHDENQKKNSEDSEEEKLGIIYIYQDEQFTKKIADDLSRLKQNLHERMINKISQLWNFEPEKINHEAKKYNISILDYKLTKSQNEAYTYMINNSFSLIEGPPGTGKTHLIATFAADMILMNKKTVITSTNNRAVDNVYQKLKEFDHKNENNLKTGKILYGYARLGSKNYIEKFIESLFNLVNELKQFNSKEIEENITQLKSEVDTLESFINKYLLIQNFSIDELSQYFTDHHSMKKFNEEQLLTLKILLERLNTWYANLFPLSLFISRKYKETLANFCHERGLILPALKDRKYLSCREIYNREKDKIDLLQKVCDLNCIEKELKNLAENVKRIVNENSDDMNRLFELAGKFYYLRKRELNYWQLAADKKWIDKIEERKKDIENKKFWGLEDYIFKFAPVIITTALTSPSVCKQEVDIIDYVIVDEAAQTLFCYTFPLFIRGRHFIAIGDDNQLGPVITNIDYLELPHGLKSYLSCDKTAYDVVKAITKGKYIGLKEHFRCARPIIEFCNKLINYRLKIETREERLNIKNSTISKLFEKNITFIDVKGQSKGNRSKYNEEEIKLIVKIINELKSDIDLKYVGIIAPYRLQVDKLKNSLKNFKNLTIGTVHTFQGEERDIIILSCVCGSTEEYQRSKLLNDRKLMNVAVSRAKRHLIVIGNKDAIENIPDSFSSPIKTLLDHISKEGKIILKENNEGLPNFPVEYRNRRA